MSTMIAPRTTAGSAARLPTPARILVPACIAVLLFAPGYLPALEQDEDQPLYLESDSAELDDAKSLSIYTGDVFVKQGSMEVRGDQVTIHHDTARKPELIIAVGEPATYQQQVEGEEEMVQAEALRMEYEVEKDEITLIDQAVLYQGTDTFRSDRIVFYRAVGLVKAGADVEGKERVKIELSPDRQ